MIRYENELTEDSRFPVEIFEQNSDRRTAGKRPFAVIGAG